MKHDGYRVQAQVNGGCVSLFTRDGEDWTDRIGAVAAAVAELPVNNIVLDGEVIAAGKKGASDFATLQNDLAKGRSGRLVYTIFDLLYLDGFDIRAAPLVERKRVLQELLREAGLSRLQYCEHVEIEGEKMRASVCAMGLQGIVSKRRDAPYRSGRVESWVTVKCRKAGRARVQRKSAKAVTKAPSKARAASRRPRMSKPLLIIDGDSFAHRAYHGVPKTVRRAGNRGGGAIVGFANYLMRFYEAEQPRAVIVGWDTLDAPTYRSKAFPDYQSGREFDDELLDQLNVLPEFVAACGFATAKAPGYEADDFLAAAVAYEEQRKGTAVVASGDRDTFQLASESTTIVHPMRGGVMARIGPAEVRERYGVDPIQVPDFIALRGDPSDKLPGARGVGSKGAASLLQKYRTLEDALNDGRFAGQADALRLYRRIATMDASAPLPPLKDQAPTWLKASTLAREWELKQLAERLAGLAKGRD